MPDRMSAFGALLDTFEEMRGITESITDLGEDVLDRPLNRPGLDTFAKHLAEILEVETAYIAALETGVVDLTPVPSVFEFDSIDPEEFKERSAELGQRLRALLDEDRIVATCEWNGYEMDSASILAILAAHEAQHQGQIMAFMYQLGIAIPEGMASYWVMPKRV